MKVLVTGATGFIGKYLVAELVKYGHEIIATARRGSIPSSISWINDVTYVSCDLNDKRDDFYNFFKRPDLLIHLSWEGLPNYNELFHIEKNLSNNYFFIKNMIEHGLINLSVVGTCFEYGMQSGRLSEDTEAIPVNSYAVAKDALRRFIELLRKKYPATFKWIRLFYPYGEGQGRNSVLEQLKLSLSNNEKIFNMSGGEQLRDYLPAEKAAEYIARISLQNEIQGIVNCCSGVPISIRKLVENYLGRVNKTIELNLGYYPYPDYEPMAFWGDDTKLKRIMALYK